MGFPVLQKRFPGIKAVANGKVLEGIWPMYTPEWTERWKAFFPNQVDATTHEWEALPASNELNLDGHILKAYDVVQGDSSAKSFLHVPSLDLVIAGDLVYGDCYQYLAEANTKERRASWIKAVEQIEGLKPKIVVAGHKRRSQVDGAYLTETTKVYSSV